MSVSPLRALVCALIASLALQAEACASYLMDSRALLQTGAAFSWEDAQTKSLKISIHYRDPEGNPKQARLGSGFLISNDGLFVTAYHVVQYCLEKRHEKNEFSAPVHCSTAHPRLQYRAENGGKEYEIQVVSHLRGSDSIGGGSSQTPDQIIKHRDFVVARLVARPEQRFAHWPIKDFRHGTIDPARAKADFELRPLMPPRKVFIAGFPGDRGFAIAHGFLNLTDDQQRGYFATDMRVYEQSYLVSVGIPANTRWGIGVENNISGGAVIDASGSLVGVVVNGDSNTSGVLSIENVIETFFTRSSSRNGARPAVVLSPTQTPLYLR